MASFWAVLFLGFWFWFGFVAVLLQVLVRYLGPHSGTQVPILVWLMAWLFAMFLCRSLFGRRSAFRDPGLHLETQVLIYLGTQVRPFLGLVRRGYLHFSFVEFCLGLRSAFRDPGLHLGLAFDLWRLGSTFMLCGYLEYGDLEYVQVKTLSGHYVTL